MDYGRIKPGDDPNSGPVFNAEIWNYLLQMVSEYRSQTTANRPSQRKPQIPFATDVVTVQNTGGDNIPRYRIIMLDNALIEPSDNSAEFQRRVVFGGVTPTGDAAGRWGVLIDALTPGMVGRVAVIGVVTAWINLVDTGDTAVEAVTGSYVPHSSGSGSATILYVAGGVGSADATGEQWAIIKIGGGSSSMVGQYEGQVYGDITTSTGGFFFPAATPMTS